MNIVILNDNATINGGAAKIALESALVLAQSGYRVHLVTAVGPVSPLLQGKENLTVHCLGIHEILDDPNRLRAIAYGWWNPAARTYVADLLDSLSTSDTVVHVHNWAKALTSSAVKAAIDRGFEVVLTLHDFQIACPTGTLFLHPQQQKCTLRPMSSACIRTNCDVRSYQHKLWRVGRQAVQSSMGKMPSGIRHYVHYSHMVLDLLQPYLPSNSTFYALPNPVEINYVGPANVAENEVFTFLGRLASEKGVELFARAAGAEAVPCRFIGEGMARDVIARANPKAIMSGWMSHDHGLLALRDARALVFPSLWYETLGLVVLEAAGNGVPSIVADDCAARESVVDGVTGLYFRSGDEADLRAKLAILRDPEVARAMGLAAHQRFWSSAGADLNQHHLELEKVYARVLVAQNS